MAQGNLILGTMKGKLGDVVAYNYNGKQAARVRRRQVSNPKSSKQAIQRAIAATVAKFVSAFAPVLNNSLQNESSKVSTLAKIRSLNMTMLRQLAAQNNGNYTPKGSMYVAPNAYIVSRGSLNNLPIREESTSSGGLEHGQIFLQDGSFDPSTTLTASQAFPSIAVGDQITILATSLNEAAGGIRCANCRFAFKDNTTPIFIAAENNLFKLNPAAIDLEKAEGQWGAIRFETDDIVISAIIQGNTVGDPIDMAGIIISRENGKMRSSSHMLVSAAAAANHTLADVYPTYMAGGTPIDMPSELYLNNDANAEG